MSTSLATLLAAVLMSQTNAALEIEAGKQLPQSLSVSTQSDDGSEQTATVPYLLFTPEDYQDAGEPWPLMLFLHGLGESGNNELDRVKIHGPPKLVETRPDFQFLVVSPQCPPPDRDMEKITTAWNPDQLIRLLDHVSENLNVDPARVYVTGLSMGGFGTWRLAAAHPQRFAAAVPICGGGDPDTMAGTLNKLPIWAFHGDQDPVVPVSRSQEMVDAVRAAGGDVRLTIYPDLGHDCWTQAYDDAALYDWLLSHQLPEE